jgi:hypothetical protein
VEYTFYKINSYFVHRWKKARDHIASGLQNANTLGKAAEALKRRSLESYGHVG